MSAENNMFNVGGSVESAESGNYAINVRAILSEAWSYTLANRFSIVIGMVFVLFVSMLSVMVAASFLGDVETLIQNEQSMVIVNLVVTVMTAPFLVGIEMMGIYHAVGKKTKPNLVFSFLSRGSWVVIASIITMTLTNLGFRLFVIPGIFLAIAFLPVNQLIVEKKMSPFHAMSTCAKAFFRKQWLQLFVLYGFVFGCAMASMLPMVLLSGIPALGLGISLVLFTFLIPFYYNVKGVLYREVFGVTTDEESASSTVVSNDNTFDA